MVVVVRVAVEMGFSPLFLCIGVGVLEDASASALKWCFLRVHGSFADSVRDAQISAKRVFRDTCSGLVTSTSDDD